MKSKRKHHSVYFKLWLRVKNRLDYFVSRRGFSNGIVVSDDEWAIQYRKFTMRFEILDSYLKGKNPNWFCADHLSNEERLRRNESYKK